MTTIIQRKTDQSKPMKPKPSKSNQSEVDKPKTEPAKPSQIKQISQSYYSVTYLFN
jgi:hypothetical protein